MTKLFGSICQIYSMNQQNAAANRSPGGDRRSISSDQLIERRLEMIDNSTNAKAPGSGDVPRVGGEDDARACDTDVRVGGEDDAREIIDEPFRSAGAAEEN
jgi:hypothetical protein